MTTLVLNVFNRVKQVKLVKESLDLVHIAAEVYQTYKTEVKAHHSLQQSKPIEEVYLKACIKVTAQKPEEVKERPDYKALEFSFKNIRQVRARSSERMHQIAESVENVGQKVKQAASSAREVAEVKLDSAKNKLKYLRNRSLSLAKNIALELYQSAVNVYDSLAAFIASILNSEQVKKALAALSKGWAKMKEIAIFSLLMAKNFSLDVINLGSEKLNNLPAFKFAKVFALKEFENIRQASLFVLHTIMKNEQSLYQLKKYVGHHNSLAFGKNRKLILLLFAENLKMLKNFFGHLDFEVFFSPKESWRIVEDTKGFIDFVTGGPANSNATTIEIIDKKSR